MALTDNNNMVMPVAPMYNGYGGMNNGFNDCMGGGYIFWFVILILALGGGWGNRNNGGNASDSILPFLMANNNNSAANTNNDVQRGFDQQAIMSGITGINSNVQNGFAGVNQAICQSTAGITAAVNNGFAQNEISNNARQMADMQQNFALSQQLAQCCCENRLATANLNSTILAENCNDRQVLSDGLRDIAAQNTANTNALLQTVNQGIQSIQDTLCQNKIDEKNDRIRQLENQNTLMAIRSEATANRQAIIADNLIQTQALEQYLNPTAIPAYIVNPPGCNNNYYNNNSCCGR